MWARSGWGQASRLQRSPVDRRRRSSAVTKLSAWKSRLDSDRCRGGLGPERLDPDAVWADDAPTRFGHFVPDAGNIAEGLGDDQPGVLRELLEELALGIELAQRRDVGGVE